MVLSLLGLALFVPCDFLQAAAAGQLEYNRDVRPLLAQHCFKCHGMDEHGRKGELRLDVRENALGKGESGEVAIVPGDPDKSEVIKRILSTDKDEVMPPPHTKTVLPEAVKTVLQEWIRQGARYDKHWAFVAPVQVALPAEGGHPIDAFIRKRLSEAGLKPSGEADRVTLLRRVSLDLTGLPPSPKEADEFLKDTGADAYERMVDRLLASPQYGERWARRWLDLARYADSNGYEKDKPRTIWPYRDWVVRALNADMPFNEFSIKQLAGDMLPAATPDDLVATGFHRNTMLNEEGGIDPLEYRFHSMTDRVAVTGAAWMGLTLNCAQCHTHKYDPILHTDYFRVMALLNNASEPFYYIPTPAVEQRKKDEEARIQKLEAGLEDQFPGGREAMEKAFAQWVAEEKPKASHWQVLRASQIETNLPILKQLEDGFFLASGDVTKSDEYRLTFKAQIKGIRALRIEVASHSSLPNDGPGMAAFDNVGGVFLSEIQAFENGVARRFKSGVSIQDVVVEKPAPPKEGEKAEAPKKPEGNPKFKAASAIDGNMASGWQINGGYGVRDAAVFTFEEPVDLTEGLLVKLFSEFYSPRSLGHFRISVTSSDHAIPTGHPAEVEELLAAGVVELREPLLKRFLETAPEMKEKVAGILASRKNPIRGQITLVMKERPESEQRKTHRHHRGEYLQPKEEVSGGVPAFLPQLPTDVPSNRLTFARWLFSKENPLTSRVTVNRQWQAFFGRGIVSSLDDFGYQSEHPTHPELLDWLAVEFANQGWSMKKLHRLIVTSATYKQSSRTTPELAEKDPNNLLLARGPRFRLDAELIRDSALKASGVLSAKMGGPGVFPPQPASVTTEGAYEGGFQWRVSQGEDRYRRSLYTFMRRTTPFAMSLTFDGPSGEACLAKREVSNSPLQALTLLNDEMFVEIARAMAKAVMAEAQTDEARIQSIFGRCVTRQAAPEEMGLFAKFIEKQRSLQTSEEMLWTVVSRAVLNLDESITHP